VELGAILTRFNFNLDRFPEAILPQGKGVGANVKEVIKNALGYIESTCAKNSKCNDYFKSLDKKRPISLRQILDEKRLDIYRLRPKVEGETDEDLVAGYTLGWGDDYAQIGLNRRYLTDFLSAAGTLLHELAHVAGAPGRDEDPDSLAAELALKHCGIRSKFDPEAKG
jgi:hypothetical protein